MEGNIYLLDVLAPSATSPASPPPRSNEGLSFKPVLEGKQATVRDVLYGVYNGGTKPGMHASSRGIGSSSSTTSWTARCARRNSSISRRIPTNSRAAPRSQGGRIDRQRTPGTTKSILPAILGYADKLKEMEALLLAEMRRLDDPWRLWNQPDDGLVPPPDAEPKVGKEKAMGNNAERTKTNP